MGMLSDRMCGGDGFGEARKEDYAFGPYIAGKSDSERKEAIREHADSGLPLSDEMRLQDTTERGKQ